MWGKKQTTPKPGLKVSIFNDGSHLVNMKSNNF